MSDPVQLHGKNDTDSLYTGLPLQPPAQTIRVLDITPGVFEADIQGTLRVVSLSSATKYEALSYTWGTNTGNYHIRLNDSHTVSITDNLSLALRRLRSRWTARTIWIDALCINQADVVEKSHQIGAMGSIYRLARCTIIWLGEPEIHPETKKSLIYMRYRTGSSLTSRINLPHRLSKSLIGDGLAFAIYFALAANLPNWHERTWVAQEYVLSRRVYFQIGDTCVGNHLEKHSSSMLGRNSEVYISEFLSQLRQLNNAFVRGYGGLSLLDTWVTVRKMDATNPLDKVYGLLSLVNPEEGELITVDYTKSVGDVYANATYASLAGADAWAILGMVAFHMPAIENLPTWAVDFTRCSARGTIDRHLEDFMWTLRRGKFGGLWPLKIVPPAPRLSADGRVLFASGIPLDFVTQVLRTKDHQNWELTSREIALFLVLTLMPRVPLPARHQMDDMKIPHREHASVSASLFRFDDDKKDRYSRDLCAAIFAAWDGMYDFFPSKRPPRSIGFDRDLSYYATELSSGQCFFATAAGFVGIGLDTIAEGDTIALLHNSPMAVVLSPRGDQYAFRGFANVWGTLDDELKMFLKDVEVEVREFAIR